jgi:hypothetical protein
MTVLRTVTATAVFLAAGQVWAGIDKPRFILLLDNSTSMTQNLAGVQSHGDGSETQPGCNIDGKATAGWAYDDSKLYLAKNAIIDTISAFGSAEFALATYSRTALGQPCSSAAECSGRVAGAVCEVAPGSGTTQTFCAYHGGDIYQECASPGSGCVNCATPVDTNDLVFDWGAFDCLYTKCSYAQGCIGGQVIVGFPSTAASNLTDIYRWIDGKEDLPPFTATSNREIRAVTMTPLASALDSVLGWLGDASKTNIGLGAGLLSTNAAARDLRASCRPYNIILITDGEDTCSPNSTNDPVTAADAAYRAGVNVYVVGFGTGFSTVLNNMAMAGSGQKRSAYFAANRSDLTASLGDILINAVPKAKCSCDASCYDEALAFPQKGQPCTVGVGRCKRQGVYACNAAGDGVVCATAAACGAPALVAGTPVAEQCGTLVGCQAPSAADCADENCDGTIDEGLSCTCSSKPEMCNGVDDNCNGVVDDIAQIACGVDLGACKKGLTACVPDGAGSQQVVCQGSVGPTTEVCDGIDNDCDGVIDQFARRCYPADSAGCSYDTVSKTWTCAGACQTGFQTCSAGVWQACVASVIPVTEIACDGIDNNCDGRVDETNPLVTDLCYPANTAGCDLTSGKCVGACAFGHMACASNKMGTTCVGARVPVAELCNGKDDNCDGRVDEAFPTLGQPCNQQSCQGAGQLVCNAAGSDVECTVTAAGPSPEICDGRDNDCDGLVDEAPGVGEPAMPGVGVSCGSSVGECAAGTSVCSGGKIVCNGVGPTAEVCDGKDNDCNGSIDDNLVVPADSCNPDGMTAGQPMVGECRPGTFACRGSEGWKCQGGVGPVAEVCDGKDNDCDGQIDNNATCAAGYVCINSECVPTCHEGGEQFACAADRYCSDGACIVKACARTPCATGFTCRADGTCVDACSLVTCLEGATCKHGVCVDCYSQGCSVGQRCIQRHCAADLCANKNCGAGTFCKAGACVPSCAGVACPVGQVCTQGVCTKDPCPVSCGSDSYCDAATGSCQPRHCAGVACPAGKVCLNATGLCSSDPCEQVRCATGQTCQVSADGVPDCATVLIAGVTKKVQVAGTGVFGCAIGAHNPGSGLREQAVSLFLAMAAGFMVGRRRRR